MDSVLAGVSTAELRRILDVTDSLTVHRAITAEIASRGSDALSVPSFKTEAPRASALSRSSRRSSKRARPPRPPTSGPDDPASSTTTGRGTGAVPKRPTDPVNLEEDSSGDDDDVDDDASGARSIAGQPPNALQATAGATPNAMQSAELMAMMADVTQRMAKFSVGSSGSGASGADSDSGLARRNAMTKADRQRARPGHRPTGSARDLIQQREIQSAPATPADRGRNVQQRGIPKGGANPLIASNTDAQHLQGLAAIAGVPNDDIQAEGEDGFKAGTHSVHGTLVCTEFLVANCPNDIAQDAFAFVRAQGLDTNYPLTWGVALGHRGYSWVDRVDLPAKPTVGVTSFNVRGKFDRMTGTTPAAWNIVFDGGYKEAEYQTVEIEAYMNGRIVNAKAVADQLKMYYQMTHITASAIAPHLERSRDRYDNQALYCYMMLNAIQLDDYARSGIAPLALPQLAGAFEVRDYAVPLVENDINTDFGLRRIVIEGPAFTPRELAILQVVASGFPRWAAPIAPAANMSIHVLESLTSPIIPMALHTNGVPVPIPPPTNAEEYWNTCLKLASHRHEIPDMLRGITRAMVIANGRIRTRATAPLHNVFETCCLERYNVHMPTPLDTNFMWPLLGIQTYAGAPGHFAQHEIAAVYSQNLRQTVLAGVRIAGAMSSAVGTVLHNYNLGGEELSAIVTNSMAGGQLLIMGNGLFKARPLLSELGIFRMAVGVLLKTTALKIQPASFRSQAWSGMTYGIPHPLTSAEEWGATYTWHIPYQTDPLSMLYMYESLPPAWGYTGRAPVVDISHAITQTNVLGNIPEWQDIRSCTGYEAMAKSYTGQLIVTHGILAFNAIVQHFGWGTFTWQMDAIHMMADGNIQPRFRLSARPFVPALYPGVTSVRVGTYRTYCWVAQEVMAPVVTNMVQADLSQLARGPMILNHAGIIVPGITPSPKNVFSGLATLYMPGFDDMDDSYPQIPQAVHIKPGHALQESESKKWKAEN